LPYFVVSDCCSYLQQRGWDVTYLPVGSDGRIDLGQLADSLRPDTALVSIMAVNNEIGVRQPLAEIGALCRERKVFFHTDAAQVRLRLRFAWAVGCLSAE
jgi:cysteine desulfurase